ncbi:RHS repeat-associated core domain-containing protein [Vibrio coralliilyticus]|uniref:RHS repeat-associated core domain-containing protein n=1 Tax=Vibrio coralliilyticus TaxID=190893 RepID=UPI0020A59238|nr:RHS repeat-associated core domain-containing protein [Vibrio coralliilyticus]
MKSNRFTHTYAVYVVSLLAAAFSHPALSLTSEEGKSIELSGDFSASGGQATYSLPIAVSPGRAGLQPSVSLEYRSDSPNGMLGMGWSLGGLSSISRCGKNLNKDGRWGGVRFNADDRFCLDGQRLIAVSGRDGENLTEYRVETNGYSKIVSFGRAGNGPASFKVWYKDGSVYEYGATSDSRAELPGQSHAYKWSLNKITDTSKNNHVQFSYHEDNSNGTHRIDNISYVGGKVSFEYEARTDQIAQYLFGSQLKRNVRLKTIKTFDASNAPVGSYNLKYTYSGITARSLLNTVDYCSNGQCSTEINFSWNNSHNVLSRTSTSLNFEEVSFFDTDRNGMFEPYGMSKKTPNPACLGYKSHLNQGVAKGLKGESINNVGGYALSGSLDSPNLVARSYEYNIKGKICANLPGPSDNRDITKYDYYFDLKKRLKSYSPNTNGVLATYQSEHSAGDLNGDGKETLFLSPRGKSLPITGVADIDGDGIDDYHVTWGPSIIFYLSSRGHKEYLLGVHNKDVLITYFTADVNNDNYRDLIYLDHERRVRIYLFNGHSFVHKFTSGVLSKDDADISKIKAIDYNADGYPEIYVNGRFYKNNFGNINFSQTIGSNVSKIEQLVDYNSDGIVDFVRNDNDKLYLLTSSAYPTDKISKIEEFAIEYRVSYKVATDTSVHKQKRYYSFPYVNSTPTAYLVSSVVKQPKGYASTSYSYQYEGAKSHYLGGGFLGFEKITETENAEVTTRTETIFEQLDVVKAGEPKLVSVFKNNKKVSETSYSYQKLTNQGYGAKYYQLYANKVVKKKYGLSSSAVERQEVITRSMDRFGNLINEKSELSSELEGAGSFTSNTQYQYVSTGVNQNHYIYDITSVSNVNNLDTLLRTYKAGMGRYCGENGEVFFKPNDYIVLIHSDVDIPLVLERYDSYFKYQSSSYSVDLDGLTVYKGQLASSSASEFNNSNAKSCGSYSYNDYDGDGNMEFTTSSMTRVQTVGQTGENYWKIGAVASSISTIVDNTTNLKRTIANQYDYSSNGFLISDKTTSSDYESSGDIALAGKSITTQYSYDDWGNVVSQSVEGADLAKRTTTTQFDAQSLFSTASANAVGHRTSTQFDAQGRLKQSVSPLKGRTTGYTYDAFSRVLTETLPGTSNINHTSYGLGSQCKDGTLQTVSCVTTSPATGGKVVTHFDYAGREIRKLHTGFSGQLVVVDTRWDRNGRKVSVTRPQFLSKKTPAPVVTFTYDELNRQLTKQEPASNGGVASFTTRYQGYLTSVTDARGFEHSTLTNIMGHILRKNEPDSAYQTYQYYPDGKLRSSTDSAGNTTQIRYDNLGHRNSLDDPDMGQWSYNYNAAGELVYKRDAKGTVTTIEYDNLGRKVKQTEGSNVSTWRYDERGALGTLSGFAGNGSETDYYYNTAGLTEEVAVQVGDEKFSTHYFYDKFERVAREVRPNGIDTTLAGAAKLLSSTNSNDRLAVEYVYNPYGYVAGVRSPRNYADEVFTSASFREGIRELLNDAIAQANVYLTKAERYATQESFFTTKAAEYNSKTVNVHNLDASSQALLGDGYRYKQWCNDQGECYLRPATWVLLHDDVSIPLDITLEGAIYRLTTTLANTQPGVRNYSATIHTVPASEFNAQNLSASHDFLLTDYDSNGQKDLMSNNDIYIAQADSETRDELLFAADDLSEAATVANTRYKFYTDLASQLINLSEKVAELSGLNCEYANQLGGNQLEASSRNHCENTQQSSQADHLNMILTQSEMEESLDNPAYLYYWQRRETDAYDHTLSETLGNGLVNTYSHDANTGRPNYITTHKANVLFDPRLSASTNQGRNIRFIQYRYDNHNNVTYRYDEHLGITDTWTYDGLDRVTSNTISLANKTQHGVDNPDLAGPFNYRYDKLGNLIHKSDIGDYHYSGQQAGPHAVTKANGLNYQYDDNGNMLRAWADGNSTNERELEWTEFNKPNKITRNGKIVEFFYDANHNRYLKKNSDGIETFYFGKSYERVKDTNTGIVQHKHFVYADGKLIALNTQTKGAEDDLQDKQVRYLHYDALNSVDMITDGYGLVVERRSYDTWGKQRKVAWSNNGPLDVVQNAITNRGYTGHEEITEVGLVHMNGRVYDQELGRFISPDPVVQAPYVTNSFNRYAYVMNNPLKYTDPSGYWWRDSSGSGATGECRTDGTNHDGISGRNSNRNDRGSDNGSNEKTGAAKENKPEESNDKVSEDSSNSNSTKSSKGEGISEEQVARELGYINEVMNRVDEELDAEAERYAYTNAMNDLFDDMDFKKVLDVEFSAGYQSGPVNSGTNGKSGSVGSSFDAGPVNVSVNHDLKSNTTTTKVSVGRSVETPVGGAGVSGYAASDGKVGVEASANLGKASAGVDASVDTKSAISNVSSLDARINRYFKEKFKFKYK